MISFKETIAKVPNFQETKAGPLRRLSALPLLQILRADSDEISTYDTNGGLTKQMVFTHKYVDSSTTTFTLNEKSSKTVSTKSHDFDCTGGRSREISSTIYRKSFDFVISQPGTTDLKGSVELECYDNMTTACG